MVKMRNRNKQVLISLTGAALLCTGALRVGQSSDNTSGFNLQIVQAAKRLTGLS